MILAFAGAQGDQPGKGFYGKSFTNTDGPYGENMTNTGPVNKWLNYMNQQRFRLMIFSTSWKMTTNSLSP